MGWKDAERETPLRQKKNGKRVREWNQHARKRLVCPVHHPDREADHGKIPRQRAQGVCVGALEAVRRNALAERFLRDDGFIWQRACQVAAPCAGRGPALSHRCTRKRCEADSIPRRRSSQPSRGETHVTTRFYYRGSVPTRLGEGGARRSLDPRSFTSSVGAVRPLRRP